MSEARSHRSQSPPAPDAPPRPAKVGPRPRPRAPPPDDEPLYPLDPPLVDVRIPVKAPHATATAYSRESLRHRFPDAEVGDDLHMLFSEPGEAGKTGKTVKEKRSRLSPDVFVALNVSRRATRADYDADLLGPPDFVLEVLSASTWRHDLGRKLDCYQRLGVRECLLFDATRAVPAGAGGNRDRNGDLWGFALTPSRREHLAERALPNGERGVYSEVLGLWAYVAERTPPAAPGETWALAMRWHDREMAVDIPDYSEARAEMQAARARADAERNRAEAARSKIAELEARLRQLRGQP